MKRIVAFTLMLVLVLACLAPAIAATAELTAMSHGGTAQTGYVKKTKTGDPSVTINSLTGLQDTLLLNFRIRYSNGTAATSNYTFSGTGPRTVYYLNADGFNAVDSSFFARVQTQSAQTTSVTIIAILKNPVNNHQQ